MSEFTYTYGNNPSFHFETLSAQDGILQASTATALRAGISEDIYHNALDDINSTFKVYEDQETGKQFEIAIANPEAKTGLADVELSTFSSSISGNIGNAVEFAEHSALHTDRARIYVASLGNGGSSYWDESERNYITQTGRFVQVDGESLPTIAALSRVLQKVGELTVSRFSTNSAGGSYATALMAALPEGQITHGYLKSRPNISNHPTKLLWGAGLMLAEQYDSRQYKANTGDQWTLTQELMDTAQQRLSGIYAEGKGAAWSAGNAAKEKGIKRLYWDMLAFSKGGKKHGFPASQDTTDALKHQPDAQLTYHFPEKDRLYGDLRNDVSEFIRRIQFANSVGQVEALFMPGTHHDHSQYPTLRWSIERYAFDK